MWKNTLALSALISSIALLTHTIQPAQADLGPSASMGNNPIFSFGGYSSGTASQALPAQSGQEYLITDVSISAQFNYEMEIVFTTTGGAEIGRYKAWNYSNYSSGGIVDSHLISGLRVPENEGLNVTINGHGAYTFSGRSVHP